MVTSVHSKYTHPAPVMSRSFCDADYFKLRWALTADPDRLLCSVIIQIVIVENYTLILQRFVVLNMLVEFYLVGKTKLYDRFQIELNLA